MGRNKIRKHKADLQKRSCRVIMHLNQLVFIGYLIYETIVDRTEEKCILPLKRMKFSRNRK